MDAVARLRAIAGAADAAVELLGQRGAGDDVGQNGEPAGAGQRFNRRLFELCLRAGALNVDDRCFA